MIYGGNNGMLDIPEDSGQEEEEPIEKKKEEEIETKDPEKPSDEKEKLVEIEEESKIEESIDPTEEIPLKQETFNLEFLKPIFESKGFVLQLSSYLKAPI
jgi:hypothetical protein